MEAKTKKRILTGLRVIEGHIRGVERMIEAEAHWLEIIRQTIAIRGSVQRLSRFLLQEHLSTTTRACLVSGDLAARRKALDEILSLLVDQRLCTSEPTTEQHQMPEQAYRCHPAGDT